MLLNHQTPLCNCHNGEIPISYHMTSLSSNLMDKIRVMYRRRQFAVAQPLITPDHLTQNYGFIVLWVLVAMGHTLFHINPCIHTCVRTCILNTNLVQTSCHRDDVIIVQKMSEARNRKAGFFKVLHHDILTSFLHMGLVHLRLWPTDFGICLALTW